MNNIHNDSLKEYYIKLLGLYENAVNMLTAINSSLSTSASEITIDMNDENGVMSKVRIPSFLYLESKLEQLENNFSNLFKMPKSGEAWFDKSSNMYKLQMIRSNTAPISPIISDATEINAGLKQNNLLKDLVSPKTFLKLNLANIPSNIDKMFMKKIVIFNSSLFESLKALNIKTYDQYSAALFNYVKGKDYEEYDSIIDMPIKRDIYKSAFHIEEIPVIETGNPWVDGGSTNSSALSYKVRLNTIKYYDQEDASISFTLKNGDYICLGNEMAIYKVKNVDTLTNEVIIEEYVGHISLQTYAENASMTFQVYNDNYDAYSYVEVPLEENRYICVFIGSLYNNVRSLFSDALLIDLNNVYIKDAGNNYILDSYGNRMSYIQYYNEFCMNIGDLILGLTQAAYPQLSNYNAAQLADMQNNEDMIKLVTGTLNAENILKVVPINKHLTDDQMAEDIKELHAQKNDINAQIKTVQENINQVYNQLLTVDFSQETSVTQQALQSQIQKYYTQRTSLEKQLNAVIDSMNVRTAELSNINSSIKYRIRGVANVAELETYIKGIGDKKCDIIAMDVEYKYKSTSKDTSTVSIINSSTFTDWNKLDNIERQRKLVFDDTMSSYRLDFVDYSKTDNIIKWNQVDIPITKGEDVVIRVRYKLNIGQPFVNIFTPWSDEMTVVFPVEFNEDIEVKSIVDTNKNDTITAGYRKILIDEGYEQHIQNKIVSSDHLFFHQPENIYSGFNTAENNLISLKDKLIEIVNNVERYKVLIDNETNAKFDVLLEFDNQTVLLSPNIVNKINIYNSDHISGSYIRKDINLIFKNTGNVRINLYSIFPGNTQIPLLLSDIEFYNQTIHMYERIPMMVNNEICPQYLGQWIYFRQTNPYNRNEIYYNNQVQNNLDINSAMIPTDAGMYEMNFISENSDYLSKKNRQVLLGYRERGNNSNYYYNTLKNTVAVMHDLDNMLDSYIEYKATQIVNQKVSNAKDNAYDLNTDDIATNIANKRKELRDLLMNIQSPEELSNDLYVDKPLSFFMYKNTVYNGQGVDNKYLMKYEDIQGKNANNQIVYLDKVTPISNFLTSYKPVGFAQVSDFSGAFLFPNLLSLSQIMTEGGEKDSIFIEVGQSISLPLVFEYYLDGDVHKTITKSLHFDIRNSLVSNPLHFMLELTGNYDYSASGDIYTNIDNVELSDNVTLGSL